MIKLYITARYIKYKYKAYRLLAILKKYDEYISFGLMFTNSDFTKITIIDFYNIKSLSYYKRPFEITAPANNRIKALEIYDELTQ